MAELRCTAKPPASEACSPNGSQTSPSIRITWGWGMIMKMQIPEPSRTQSLEGGEFRKLPGESYTARPLAWQPSECDQGSACISWIWVWDLKQPLTLNRDSTGHSPGDCLFSLAFSFSNQKLFEERTPISNCVDVPCLQFPNSVVLVNSRFSLSVFLSVNWG